ncbi:MAG: LacI family DNA-binding transcriptional regulator [Niabella sp.]|nr:LacI family DNA-binding transcriptional regulator [Niabella sp.]
MAGTTKSDLKDVARSAGVSIATVSRVINGEAVVKEATRLAVNAAIKKLGYRPNRAAQRLRSTHRSRKLIGLLIPDIHNPYYIDIISGIDAYASAHGATIIIGDFSQDARRERIYIDTLRSESVDGCIVATTPRTEKYVESLIGEGFPVVCIDRELKNLITDVVKSDNETGAFAATEHLIKLGHKRIAHIAGDLQIPTSHERIAGYRAAHQQYKLRVDEGLIISKHSNYESGVELAAQVLKMKKRPTAIFTGNNLLTLGVLEVLHGQGVKIPQEIAIVGFDDMYWANSLNPALTAVRQFGYEIGHQAIELLFKRIEAPQRPPVSHIVNTQLMIRKSCGTKS